MVSMKRIKEAIEQNDYKIEHEDMVFQYGFGRLALVGGFFIVVDGEIIYLKLKDDTQKIPLSWFKIDKTMLR